MIRKTRRPTFNIKVRDLPIGITQRDIEKKFTQYGEVASLFVRHSIDGLRITEATIKYLCEPDAIRATTENNGLLWNGSLISVRKMPDKNRDPPDNVNQNWNSVRGGHMHQRAPFYKPIGIVKSVNTVSPMGMNINENIYRQNVGSHSQASSASSQGSNSSPMDIREIICTNVEDCVTFYGHHLSEATAIDALSTRLQMLCPVLPKLRQLPTSIPMYGTLFSHDSLWYRCKVVSNNQPSGKILVQYIDYGNMEEVDPKNMVELPESLSSPSQYAPKCTFSSVEPANAEKHARKGLKYLQETILGQKLLISTSSPIGSLEYEVTECKCRGLDIIQDLFQRKFIKKKITLLWPGSCDSNSSSRTNNNIESPEKWLKAHFPNVMKQNTLNKSKPKNFSKHEKGEAKSPGKLSVAMVENEILRQEAECLKQELQKCSERCQMLENKLQQKEELPPPKANVLKELESVSSHIQFVRSLRCNLPKNDPDISNALSTLLYVNSNTNQQKKQLKETIKEMNATYQALLKEIQQCSDRLALDELIKKKNSCKDYLHEQLKKFEELVELSKLTSDSDIKDSDIQEIMEKLKSKVKSTVDMSLNNKPSSIDDVMLEYNATVIAKKDLNIKVKETTDTVLEEFCLLFSQDFLKLFSLTQDTSSEDSAIVNFSGLSPEKFLTSDKFKKTLASLQTALESEVANVYSHCEWKKTENGDQNSKCTLIECLLEELQNILDQRSLDLSLMETYHSLLNSLSETSSDMQSKLSKIDQLLELKQTIKSNKSQLRHAMVDVKDFEEDTSATLEEVMKAKIKVSNMQAALHEKFIEEDKLLEEISKLCMTNYPEYDQLYPELCLSTHMKYNGLYKNNWNLENFNLQLTIKRGESNCHHCTFAGDPVTIKEIFVENDKKENFLQKAVKWQTLSSEFLVPIKAIFQNGYQTYIMSPKRETLEEQTLPFSKAICCDILINVLQAIHHLHTANIVHGMVEPSSVLLMDEKASLDFYFKSKSASGSPSDVAFKKRHHVESQANDIFDFGCLVLGLLFPDLKIPFSGGFPDISVHRKTIEKDLSPKGYTILAYSILNKNASDRHSADELVDGLFFQYLSKIKHSRLDKIETIHCPIPAPVKQEEKSIPELTSPKLLVSEPVLVQPPVADINVIKEPVALESQISSLDTGINIPSTSSAPSFTDNEGESSGFQSNFLSSISLSEDMFLLNAQSDPCAFDVNEDKYSSQNTKEDIGEDRFEYFPHQVSDENASEDEQPSDQPLHDYDPEELELPSSPVESSEIIPDSSNTSNLKDCALAKLLSLRQSFSNNTSSKYDNSDKNME